MKSHHRLTFRLLLRFTLSHSARLLLLVLALCLATAAFAFSFVFPFALVLVVAMAFALVFVIAVPFSFLLLISDPLPALFLIVPFSFTVPANNLGLVTAASSTVLFHFVAFPAFALVSFETTKSSAGQLHHPQLLLVEAKALRHLTPAASLAV